jgi:hypothetical protein
LLRRCKGAGDTEPTPAIGPWRHPDFAALVALAALSREEEAITYSKPPKPTTSAFALKTTPLRCGHLQKPNFFGYGSGVGIELYERSGI